MGLTEGICSHYGQELKVAANHAAHKKKRGHSNWRLISEREETVENCGPGRFEEGRPVADSRSGRLFISGFQSGCPNMTNQQASVCESVMDESQCLPRGALSFPRHLPSRLTTTARNAFGSYCEKSTAVSDCTYSSHLVLAGQLRLRGKGNCPVSSLRMEAVLQRRALCSGSRCGGRPAFVLGCTLLRRGNYLQTAPLF